MLRLILAGILFLASSVVLWVMEPQVTGTVPIGTPAPVPSLTGGSPSVGPSVRPTSSQVAQSPTPAPSVAPEPSQLATEPLPLPTVPLPTAIPSVALPTAVPTAALPTVQPTCLVWVQVGGILVCLEEP
jgi:hypothetical protein